MYSRNGLGYGAVVSIAPPLRPPRGEPITRAAAPGVGTTHIVSPRLPALVWNRLPISQYEGHEPKRDFDVQANAGLAGFPWNFNRGLALGQATPEDITINLERLKTLIQSGITKAQSFGKTDLAETGKALWRDWLGIEYVTVKAGLFDQARDEITALYQRVIPWSNQVNLLGVSGAREQARLTTEASVPVQLTKSVVQIGEQAREGLSTALDVWPWAIPIAAGLALFLFLRR